MTTIALENKKKIRGVVLSDDIIKELKDTGASHVMTFKDSKGLPGAPLPSLRRQGCRHTQGLLLRALLRQAGALHLPL